MDRATASPIAGYRTRYRPVVSFPVPARSAGCKGRGPGARHRLLSTACGLVLVDDGLRDATSSRHFNAIAAGPLPQLHDVEATLRLGHRSRGRAPAPATRSR